MSWISSPAAQIFFNAHERKEGETGGEARYPTFMDISNNNYLLLLSIVIESFKINQWFSTTP